MEAFLYLKKKHMDQIEECDKYFMINIFNCPRTVPVEAYFFETSSIPIRFVLLGRKFMFLWTILQKSNDELVKRVFLAQMEFPSKNSWVSTIQRDLKECSIYLSFTKYLNQNLKIL